MPSPAQPTSPSAAAHTPLASPQAVRRLQRLAAPPLLALLRARVEGTEHVPTSGPVLLAPNHRSFLDHFAVLAAAPRPVWFLGKSELARGVSGRVNLAFGMVPIDRGAADREALGAVSALLGRGEAVVVFPEGTRSLTGELFRFRSGIARLAAECRAPVVPVGLVGTADIWPLGASRPARVPRPGDVRVRFGPPVPPPPAPAEGHGSGQSMSQSMSQGSGAARRAFTEELWERVAALCGQPKADRFAPIDHGQEVS